jgi:Na+-transporting methylmalonyl-CoA/oxaloacetate decarboxylase gamma subunit
MKKMLLILTAFVCMIGMSFAQTKKDAKAAPAKVEKAAPAAKVEKAAPAAKAAAPTKKDGTPDMRFKDNVLQMITASLGGRYHYI